MATLRSFLLLPLFIPYLLFGRDTIRVGTFPLSPFMMESEDHTRTTGVAIDFWVKHAGPQMDVEVKALGPFPANRVQKMLEDGAIDVIPNMTKNPEREKKFIVSEMPLSEITSCVVVLKKSPLKVITRQEDLFNLRLGFLEKAFIPPIMRHEKINIELVSGDDYFDRLIEMLEADRTDGFIHINYFSLKYELMLHGKKNAYRIIKLPEDKIKVYCVFTKSERGRKLSEKFNEINASLFKSKAYDLLAEEAVK